MYFPSKKGLGIGIFIWLFMIMGLYITVSIAYRTNLWVIPMMFLIPLFFVGWIWFGTGYTVKDGKLIIKYGPFKNNIYINDIIRIQNTNNPISSPSLTLDRLEIMYAGNRIVIISPKEKERFIGEVNKQIMKTRV